MRTLIENGTLVTATETVKADVVIEDEKVAAIGRGMRVEADRTIDATDRYVMPGGVDVHTHMDLPFGGSFCSDDFETGSRAAAFGGTTTIVDFALQGTGEGLRPGLELWFEKAKTSSIDYGFHMIVKEVNDQVLKEMDELVHVVQDLVVHLLHDHVEPVVDRGLRCLLEPQVEPRPEPLARAL